MRTNQIISFQICCNQGEMQNANRTKNRFPSLPKKINVLAKNETANPDNTVARCSHFVPQNINYL